MLWWNKTLFPRTHGHANDGGTQPATKDSGFHFFFPGGIILWLSWFLFPVASHALPEWEELPHYQAKSHLNGTLTATGSDTLNNLMTVWLGEFNRLYPGVTVMQDGKGSSTAPPALIKGTSQLAPMSRPMKLTEKESFRREFGYDPLEIPVAVNAVGIYVHRDNPLASISLEELDALFSSTFKRGEAPIHRWESLVNQKAWVDLPVSLYGRNSASGTYGFFKERVLLDGDFRNQVKEQPGSSAVIHAISLDKRGIGYSGINFQNSGVRLVPIRSRRGEVFAPTYEHCLSGDYPLARFLNIYINQAPGEPMEEVVLEFMKFVLSRQGQALAERNNYFPLPVSVMQSTLDTLLNQPGRSRSP